VVPSDVARRLEPSQGEDEKLVHVVISHDCDLVYSPEDEPVVEYVIGHSVDSCQPGYVHAQSPHCLHVELLKDGQPVPVELYAARKGTFLKKDLSAIDPDPHYSISPDDLVILQTWLAARYKRAALPDGLVDRMEPVKKNLAEAGKKNPKAICGIFLNFEPDDELKSAEPYELWITIVYSTLVPNSTKAAEEAVAKLQAVFEKRFKTDGVWKDIDLRQCRALADTEFTLRDLATLKQWRLEYISMRSSPAGEVF
jgi:hypothetical protein